MHRNHYPLRWPLNRTASLAIIPGTPHGYQGHMAEYTSEIIVSRSIHDLPAASMEFLRQSDNPFLDYAWFSLFCEQVAPGIGKEVWLSLMENGRTAALLPLMCYHTGRLKTLGSLGNYYSPYFGILTRDKDDITAASRLIDSARDTFRQYDVVDLHPLSPESLHVARSAFAAHYSLAHTYTHSQNWRLRNIHSFDTYWAARPSHLRNTVARKSRKMAAQDHRFEIVSDDISDRHIDNYNAIYEKSWKQPEPYPGFIPGLIESCAARGMLRLGFLYLGEEPVATQLWLVRDATAFIYKLAYDPVHAELSPGSLLSHHLFRHAIDIEGVTTIDYLTGDDRYKADWMSECRPLTGLQVAPGMRMKGLATVLSGIGKTKVRGLMGRALGNNDA